jgi:hypothetical protein
VGGTNGSAQEQDDERAALEKQIVEEARELGEWCERERDPSRAPKML